MAAYIDYTYYSGTYGGTAVSSAEFTPLALKASAMIDLLTSDRAAAIVTANQDVTTIDKIRMATCAVMDADKALEESGGVVASESVGSHSVSYALSQTQKASRTTKLTNAAKVYLNSTGLMFRGFYDDEYGSDTLSASTSL